MKQNLWTAFINIRSWDLHRKRFISFVMSASGCPQDLSVIYPSEREKNDALFIMRSPGLSSQVCKVAISAQTIQSHIASLYWNALITHCIYTIMFPSLVFSPGLQPTTTTQANMSGKIEMNNCSQEFRLTFLRAEYSAVLLHAAIPYCYSAIPWVFKETYINYSITTRSHWAFDRTIPNSSYKVNQGSVVRRPDSAIHWIAIFSTFLKLPVDRYNLRLRFGIYKLKF